MDEQQRIVIAQNVAQIQLATRAVTLKVPPENPYTYSSGMRSPIYCDNRIILSHAQERAQIVRYFLEAIRASGNEYGSIGAVGTAGIPWGALIAGELNLPLAYTRSTAKGHGKENKVEGLVEAGQHMLVIEDLVTTGGSSLRAINAFRDLEADVQHCMAIITYGFKTSYDAFRDASVVLTTLTAFPQLIDVATEKEYITPDQQRIAVSWNQDPEQWAHQQGIK
jgi:orotate phosphoribosyltransferase